MKAAFCLKAAVAAAILAGASSAPAAVDYLKHIDLSSVISPTSGITLAHVAVDESGVTPVVYVTTLNNSGATVASVPAIKIVDPLGATPTVTVFDTNDGLLSGGVSNSRGYGGVGVDASGNVFVSWSGNGSDDSARIRKYDAAGTLVQEYLFAGIASQRLGGLDVNPAGTALVGARFFNTSTQKLSIYTGAETATLTHVAPVTADPLNGGNPRDVAYDDTTGKVYINANAMLQVVTPAAGGPLTTPTNYAAANGGTASTLVNNGANSFAGHGVGVSADGTLIGYTPNPGAGIGQRTARIANSSGVLQHTLGTLDVVGTGTDGNLGRASDVAFIEGPAALTAVVPDYDDNATIANRLFTRLVIYQETSSVADWTLLQD